MNTQYNSVISHTGIVKDLLEEFSQDTNVFRQKYGSNLFLLGPRTSVSAGTTSVKLGYGEDSLLVRIVDSGMDWTFTIGQAINSQLRIDAPGAIAAHHADITRQQGSLYLMDYGSKFGTFAGRLGLEQISANKLFPIETNTQLRFGPAIPGNTPYVLYDFEHFVPWLAKVGARKEKEANPDADPFRSR